MSAQSGAADAAGRDEQMDKVQLSSVLQAQSKQIAREGSQKDWLRTVEVKMAAGKHSNLTGAHGH
jgi:hypothetical protein